MPHHFLEVALSKIFKKCKETEKSKKDLLYYIQWNVFTIVWNNIYNDVEIMIINV